MVLDEPYGGLDPAAAQALTGLLTDARAAGTAIVLSGRDPAVFPAADAVLRLAGGRLAGSGPVRTRLVLRRRDPAAVPVPGGSFDPGRGLLTVLTADPDAVLREALAGGWSHVAPRSPWAARCGCGWRSCSPPRWCACSWRWCRWCGRRSRATRPRRGRWPQVVFWILVVVSALAAALNTVLSVSRTRHVLDPT